MLLLDRSQEKELSLERMVGVPVEAWPVESLGVVTGAVPESPRVVEAAENLAAA